MADNYAALSTATVTGSSALASFPVANSVNVLRYKQWVPAGNFEITTSNNKLYFDDGAAKTATITAASYTPATLATEIQTQMNSVGSNWTVTYDTSTYKFNLVNSTTACELTITSTTNAIWSTIGFTGAADISKGIGVDFVPDAIRCHTTEWLKVDMAVPTQMDFIALIGALNEASTLSSTATVVLEGNTTDVWTSPAFSKSLSLDSQGAMQFLDDESSRTY
jgi:hypothetical protein